MTNIALKVRQGEFIYTINCEVREFEDGWLFKFPYTQALVEEFKALEKSKWQPEVTGWFVPKTEHNEYALKYLQGNRDDRYIKSYKDIQVITKRNLFPHQIEAVKFALSRRRCLINYEMGLGKTLIAIEIMEQVAKQFKKVVWWLVAPAGVLKEWERQLRKWDARIKPVILTTYESLEKNIKNWSHEPPDGVIFDESIKIKNPNAQRSQAAYQLSQHVRNKSNDTFIICLSGAPSTGTPGDWWHQIKCLCPGFIREGDIFKFINRYAITEVIDGEFGRYREVIGWKEEELDKLGKRLSPIVLSAKKENCIDLPDKIYDRIICTDITKLEVAQIIAGQQASGIKALEVLRELSDGFMYNTNEAGERIVEWVGSPKIDEIKSLLNQYSKESEASGRLVIYAAFHGSIDKLKEICNEEGWLAYSIDGRGWDKCILDVFDSPSSSNVCLVCHPGAVHGLNLQAAEALIYYSNSFNADHRIQSIERRDRLGASLNKATRVVDLINMPTDLMVLDRVEKKLSLQDITIDSVIGALNEQIIS